MIRTVYIAGPYTSAPHANTQDAIIAAEVLAEHGYIPFIPHLYHFWHDMFEHDYEFWMEQGSEFLSKCDCLVRLPGDSSGADREVAQALKEGKPVYYGIEDFINKQEAPFIDLLVKADYT